MKNNNYYLLVSTHAVIGQFSWPYLLYKKAIIKLANASYLGKKKQTKKNRRSSLLDDYYYQFPSSVANQNAGFALVH